MVKISNIASVLNSPSEMGQFDRTLRVASTIRYQESSLEFSRFYGEGTPIAVNGFPKISECINDVELKIYRSEFFHYDYKTTTLFIIAFNESLAIYLAHIFCFQINQQAKLEFPAGRDFKQLFFKGNIAPIEVLNFAKKSEAVYTVFLAK